MSKEETKKENEDQEEMNENVEVDELIETYYGDLIVAFLSSSTIVDIKEAEEYADKAFDLLIEKLDGKASMVWDEAFKNMYSILSIHTWKTVEEAVDMVIHVAELIFKKWESNK